MLGWAVTFLIGALIAAVLGFGGIAGVAIEAAKIVFFVAVVLFGIAALVGLVRGRARRLCRSVALRHASTFERKRPRATAVARGLAVCQSAQ